MVVKPIDTDAAPGSTDGYHRDAPQGDVTSSDMELLAACADGDAGAYRVLVERYLALILSIARRMLRDDAEAEDVAQETMLRLWRNAGRIVVGDAGVKSWLCRVASNQCIDRIRAMKLTTVGDELVQVPVAATQIDTVSEREVSARVDDALKALPERQRLALVLFHFEGLSQREVAGAMALSVDAVESLIARARRRLKVELEPDWRQLLPGSQQD